MLIGIDEFVGHYSAPGGLRAGFEYYKALPQDAKEIKELAASSKLPMPVLVLSGDIYPILGRPSWEQYIKLYTESVSSYKCAWYHSSTFRTLACRRATTVCYKTACQFLWPK